MTPSPEPTTCDTCGAPQGWVWWEPKRRYDTFLDITARWMREPCEYCRRARTVKDEVEMANTHAKRLKQSDMPTGLRGRSLHHVEHFRPDRNARTPEQKQREEWAGFVAAMTSPPRLGICSHPSATTLEHLRSWLPVFGARSWLYVHGDPGTGKSQMVAAYIEDQLRPTSTKWRNTDPDRPWQAGGRLTRVGSSIIPWLWRDEPQLMDDQDRKWKGNPYPLYEAAVAPYLVLDEFAQPEKRSTAHRTMRSQLVQFRINGRASQGIEGERPTVLISNTPWDTVLEEAQSGKYEGPDMLFGCRLASRLTEYCIPLEVSGLDWRPYAQRRAA